MILRGMIISSFKRAREQNAIESYRNIFFQHSDQMNRILCSALDPESKGGDKSFLSSSAWIGSVTG